MGAASCIYDASSMCVYTGVVYMCASSMSIDASTMCVYTGVTNTIMNDYMFLRSPC